MKSETDDEHRWCDKPDHDEPRLRCGSPFPCPYHTVVLSESEATDGQTLPTLAWLRRQPTVAIYSYLVNQLDGIPGPRTHIGIRAMASLCTHEHEVWIGERTSQEIWRGERTLPLTAPMRELRDAWDELTREAHVALESYLAAAAEPGPVASPDVPPGFIGTVNGGEFLCKCQARHRRGPVDGGSSYRCLNCGDVGPVLDVTPRSVP